MVKYGTESQSLTVYLKFCEGEDGGSVSLVVQIFQARKWKDDKIVVIQYPANNTGNEE